MNGANLEALAGEIVDRLNVMGSREAALIEVIAILNAAIPPETTAITLRTTLGDFRSALNGVMNQIRESEDQLRSAAREELREEVRSGLLQVTRKREALRTQVLQAPVKPDVQMLQAYVESGFLAKWFEDYQRWYEATVRLMEQG